MRFEKSSKGSPVNWTGRNESIFAWITRGEQTKENLTETLGSDPIDSIRDATVVERFANEIGVIDLDIALRVNSCRIHKQSGLVESNDQHMLCLTPKISCKGLKQGFAAKPRTIQ